MKMIAFNYENFLAYYNAGVVNVNLKIVAPEGSFF
jgi:hypothetical protein